MSNVTLPENALTQCPVCSKTDVTEFEQLENFFYGDNREEILALLPVLKCSNCNFEFTDNRAEKLRREAIYNHRKLLSPEQITAVRKNLDMSRRDFQDAYGISCASMERWENGRLFQSESIDLLLRILRDAGQARKYDRRQLGQHQQVASNVVYVDFQTRALGNAELEDAKRRSQQFSLNGRS